MPRAAGDRPHHSRDSHGAEISNQPPLLSLKRRNSENQPVIFTVRAVQFKTRAPTFKMRAPSFKSRASTFELDALKIKVDAIKFEFRPRKFKIQSLQLEVSRLMMLLTYDSDGEQRLELQASAWVASAIADDCFASKSASIMLQGRKRGRCGFLD